MRHVFPSSPFSFLTSCPSLALFFTSPYLLFLLARYFSHNANLQLPRGTGLPPTALAPPRAIAVRIPTIAPFPIPQKWVRPAFLPPPSPPRPSSPAPAPKEKDARDGTMEQGGIVEESISGGRRTSVNAEEDEGGGEKTVAGDERRKEGMIEANKTSGVDDQRSKTHDRAEGQVEKNASKSGRSNEDQREEQTVSGTDDKAQPPKEASTDCSDGAAEGTGTERGIGDEELSTKDQDKSAGNVTGAEGKGGEEVTEQKEGAPSKTLAAGAKNSVERDQQDGRKADAKVDAEAGAKADAKMIAEPGSKADAKGQAEEKDSSGDKLSAPEAEEKTNADAEAKSNAEAESKDEAEASAKAEAEGKAKADVKARAAETIAEKRVRRLRVSLILRRLRQDVDQRRGTARYTPSANPFSAPWTVRSLSGRGVAGAIIAVPGLRDSGSGSVGGSFSAETSGGGRSGDGDGNGDANTTVGSGGRTGWPPLGTRRVKPVLDRSRRLAALGRGPGPVLRLSSFAAEKDKLEGKGWLEAKLARMRKVEDGEWKAWHQRVSEEASSSPGEAAGPILPYGFVPRLAHRALGAYSLVRTMSRPLRLTPASSIAFLRAMSLKLRTPLLDAMHCGLLRRVFFLLKGRAGTWSKGTSAQRELDWKYLDQVNAWCKIGIRI